MIGKKYFKSLDILRADIVDMSKISQKSLHESIIALEKRDTEATEVFRLENIADEFYRSIQDRCIQMVALYQPVASDLRFITSAMSVSSGLERIADYSIDIAKIVHYIKEDKNSIDTVFRMAEIAEKMTTESACAFVNKDEKKVKEVLKKEEKVDALYKSIFPKLYGFISSTLESDEKNSKKRKENAYIVAINFLLIARYLERIGDHSVNIANKTLYAIKGEKEYL